MASTAFNAEQSNVLASIEAGSDGKGNRTVNLKFREGAVASHAAEIAALAEEYKGFFPFELTGDTGVFTLTKASTIQNVAFSLGKTLAKYGFIAEGQEPRVMSGLTGQERAL